MDIIKEREIAKLLDEGKVVVIGAEKGAVVVKIEENFSEDIATVL